MDDVDLAQQHEELFREQALGAHSRRQHTSFADVAGAAGPASGRGPAVAEARCKDCGSAIHPKRLAIFPEATRCVGCQSRYESSR